VKISGFTIIKNAVANDYPIVEAITSILPVVDEMIVLVGDSTDDTEALIQAINSPKIKIHPSVWNPALRKGGEALADETNKAFALIDPAADWAFYIQGDEVVHEKYHASILEACQQHKNNKKVQGLLFNYLHFYGTYDYVGDSRTWYDHEVRIIRNDKRITAYKDAQGFRIGKTKLWVKKANAYIYHYGWVKTPAQMMKKIKNVSVLWHNDNEIANNLRPDDFDFSAFDSLEIFKGSHPSVMRERIARQNLKVDIDITRKKFSFKDKLLYWFEKKTGIRPFDFRNYNLLKKG
jgi:hypothetical protein